MTKNAITEVLDRLISHGEIAYTGALAIGALVDLKHNDAAAIQAALRTVTGSPATETEPAVPGTQALYLEAVSALVAANADLRRVLADGVQLSREAIDLLRRFLGRRWNPSWTAAGLVGGSLAVPDNPEPTLLEFRSYFTTHPDHANASLGITVAAIQQKLTAIATARQAAAAALAHRIAAKDTRDRSVAALRECLVGLRSELEQLLDPDDERWVQFGFIRPIDGRKPNKVSRVTLQPGGIGQVLVIWTRAALATNYRVNWRTTGPGATPVQAGLFADRGTTLTGLPSGQTVLVAVSARNAVGESVPTETTIVVP